MKRRIIRGLRRAAVLLPMLSIGAFGATISFDVSTYQPTGTTSSRWNVVNFSGTNMNSAAYVVGQDYVSPSSTGNSKGTMVNSGSFNGFWVATMTFVLPSGAYNPVLTFSGLYADDRAVLQLNNSTIGNVTVLHNSGSGIMNLTNSTASSYTFTNGTAGTITSGFNAGTNYLTMIVNNTGTGLLSSPTRGWGDPTGDYSLAKLNGTFSYQMNSPSGVPEPASMALILAGLVPLAFALRKRRSV